MMLQICQRRCAAAGDPRQVEAVLPGPASAGDQDTTHAVTDRESTTYHTHQHQDAGLVTGKSYKLSANMPDKAAKQRVEEVREVEEVGVLPLLDSKNPRTWWYVFSACLLLTFSTRLYKVSHR